MCKNVTDLLSGEPGIAHRHGECPPIGTFACNYTVNSDATVRSGSLWINLALFVKDQTKRYPVTKRMGLHKA